MCSNIGPCTERKDDLGLETDKPHNHIGILESKPSRASGKRVMKADEMLSQEGTGADGGSEGGMKTRVSFRVTGCGGDDWFHPSGGQNLSCPHFSLFPHSHPSLFTSNPPNMRRK